MGIELLERAAEAGGRILRAELLAASEAEAVDPQRGDAFLLTFDVGRIVVEPDQDARHLELRHIENPAEASGARVPLDEEEPWWRVIGNPIARAWPGASEAVTASAPIDDLRIQFREDGDDPRIVRIRIDRGKVAVALEPAR